MDIVGNNFGVIGVLNGEEIKMSKLLIFMGIG